MNLEPEFDASADMRLLELQREALGFSAPQLPSWESRIALDDPELPPEPPIEPKGAVLAVEAVASPSTGVIPGAVVTVSLSIANEGNDAAHQVIALVPLPGGATYRPGSLVQDGRPVYDERAEEFFEAGIHLGDVAPRTRATFVWKISVRLGSKPLVIRPQVRALDAAVLGARPLTIDRREETVTAFAAELNRADAALYESRPLIPVDIPASELPIYELDDEEQLIHEAADAALSSAAPPFVAPPQESAPAEPLVETLESAVIEFPPEESIAIDEPAPAEALDSVASPEPAAVDEPPVEIAPEPAREAVVLYGRFDRATLAFFQRVFNGSKPPTILQHCIFGSALACSLDADGNDPVGLKRHLDAQAQVLHRITLHEKLGKKEPIVDYAGRLLADLGVLHPVPVTDPRGDFRDALIFQAEMSEPSLAVLRKIGEERDRWDFVKARQLTLAIQAQRLDVEPNNGDRSPIENALRVYGQRAMAALQKLFVRIRIDRSTGILSQTEPQLDAAALTLLAALEKALS